MALICGVQFNWLEKVVVVCCLIIGSLSVQDNLITTYASSKIEFVGKIQVGDTCQRYDVSGYFSHIFLLPYVFSHALFY